MPPGIKRTRENFIKLSNEKHNYSYNYNNVVYVDNLTEVEIGCQLHGIFMQSPKCHLRGHGCNECSVISSANKKILRSKENFFAKIKILDNENRWDYSEVDQDFTGTNNNITLKCKGCGNKTKRTPWNHLQKFQPCKRGCFITKNRVFHLKDNSIELLTNEIITMVETPEEWKIFPDNETYLVSNKGYIKNSKTERVIIGSLDKVSGYMRTAINKKAYSFQYIVAKTFLLNPENKPTVNHKNKIRTDNRVENLEWATYAEQNAHKNENSVKTYKHHNNGKNVLRIERETNAIIETYETVMLASKWIIENVYKIETSGKSLDSELRTISSSLSQKIKRNKNNYFGNNFIWKFKEESSEYADEIWKPIHDIEKDGYHVSNFGRIKNPSGKIKQVFGISGGYYDLKIAQSGQHHKIHRLVAKYFVENDDPINKNIVHHLNSNKLDNREANLMWVTNQENIQYAYDDGLVNSNLSPIIQYDKEGVKIMGEFKSIKDASTTLNINQSTISACCRGIQKTSGGFHFKYKY